MDLLSITNQINVELSSIRTSRRGVLSDHDQLAIFNSVVTVLADDLVDIIRLSLRNEVGQKQLVASWDYDLRNRDYPRRTGPTLPELLDVLRRAPDDISLKCETRWSRTFIALDPASQERALQGTIWGKRIAEQSNLAGNNKADNQPATREEQPTVTQNRMDMRPLEFELLKLASETSALSTRTVQDILKSISKLLEHGLIQGIQLAVIGREREEPLLQWQFELSTHQEWKRGGDSLERALTMLKEFKNRCELKVNLIPSPQFHQLPTASQRAALQDTYWDPKSQPKKRSWFS